MSEPIDRREFLRRSGAAAAAGLLSGSPLSPGALSDVKGKNILSISVDDLRPELGCYGSNFVQSPNIDRLAQRSIVFKRAYCQQSICNPSRASLFTGMRPDSIRVWDLITNFRTFRPDLITLPQYFRRNGYFAQGIGKIYHDTIPDPQSWSRPRPRIPGGLYGSPETVERQMRREAVARSMGKSQSWIMAILRGPATENFDAPDTDYRDGAMTDQAINYLAELKDNQPFFLAVGYHKPHLPFSAPRKYWNLYRREEIPLAKNTSLPKGAPSLAMNDMFELRCYEDFTNIPTPDQGNLTEDQARLLKHGYYACISFVDAQIGRLLDALDSLGLRDNTIIVLWGDHGLKLGENGSWCKGTNYEMDTRITLILSAPGMPANGGSCDGLVELVDVYPTLCDLTGLPVPTNLQGTSMAPLLENPDRLWKTAAFSQFQGGFMGRIMGRAIRTERYRYVEWSDWVDGHFIARELYDHETDPDETTNISEIPENQDIVKSLSRQLWSGWLYAKPRSSPTGR